MQKSYNDIIAQAERLIELNKTIKMFLDCHGNPEDSAIWRLAATARSQHGISRFTKDRDKKCECVRPYSIKSGSNSCWWQTKEWQDKFDKCAREREIANAEFLQKQQYQDPTKGMTYAQRFNWCVQRMQASVIEDMHFRIRDMLVKSLQFGEESQNYGCNPLQLTQAVYADARRILDSYNRTHNNNVYQLNLF